MCARGMFACAFACVCMPIARLKVVFGLCVLYVHMSKQTINTDSLAEFCVKMLLQLLHRDPVMRLSLEEVLRHRWIVQHGAKLDRRSTGGETTATAPARTPTSNSNANKENVIKNNINTNPLGLRGK